MQLTLERLSETPRGTTGRMLANGEPFCVTLERPAAKFADPHPCVPAGDYRVVLCHSSHFGRFMPLLENVPGRSGIEIHWGNFPSDFQGCIGVGSSATTQADGSPAIWNTRRAFDLLFAEIEAAQADGCTITIRDPQPAEDEHGRGNAG
jgi:Steigviridae/Suoliviridae L,D-carboxypeptidase/transpeptidase